MAGILLKPSFLQEHEGNVESLPCVDALRTLLTHAKLIRETCRNEQEKFVAEEEATERIFRYMSEFSSDNNTDLSRKLYLAFAACGSRFLDVHGPVGAGKPTALCNLDIAKCAMQQVR
eukprot:6883875-Karenia_brevis.AAC.1